MENLRYNEGNVGRWMERWGFMQPVADQLQVEGVFAKGFGILPKFVMHDPDLSLESKAIYAYLCSLAGSGHTTFPYRDTILRQLKIAKNTYYRHYNPLIEQGYIRVDRPSDKKAANIYTLVSNPKKLVEAPPPSRGEMLRYQGLKAYGYGVLPRAVMQDERLTVKAKGLYGYFCSYCGAGDCAFPRKDHILHHLGISEPTYYKALGQLKTLGYLEVVQRKEAGRFGVNDYYLCEFPGQRVEKEPYIKNCDMDGEVRKGSEKDATKGWKSDTSFCDIGKWDNKNGDAEIENSKNDDLYIITNSLNNRGSKNSLSRTDGENGKENRRQGKTEQQEWQEMLSLGKRWGRDILPEGKDGQRLLEEYFPVFAKKVQGKNIENMPAYFKAALRSYLEEQEAIKWLVENKQIERSYDLEELDNLTT